MEIHITLGPRGQLADDVYRQLRAAILAGSLRPGERLPASRDLAARLGVARKTVSAAYDRLAAEGFLHARAGAGTRVHEDAAAAAAPRRAPARAAVRPRAIWSALAAPASPGRARYDLRAGLPDAHAFPFAAWRRTTARALRSVVLDGGYPDPAGRADLRAALARSVAVARAVQAGPDDVLVTHGAQQALDLVARVLVEPGAIVAVEDPGYPLARQAFAAQGAKVVPVPVDAEGLVVARLPDAARVVYVTPSHQFPLGMPMSLERRLALLRWAARRDAVIVEDDYDAELRFAGRPLEALQSLDRAGRVLYVGTFSKVMLPGLRLGFVIAPASLHPALVTAKRLADGGCAEHDQAALARFLDDGQLARHVRRMIRTYGERREIMTAILARDFAPWLRVVPAVAGLHVCALAAPGLDTERIAERALAKGVAIGTLRGYHADTTQPVRDGLVLGYGTVPTDRIAPAMALLLAAVRAATPSPARPRPRTAR